MRRLLAKLALGAMLATACGSDGTDGAAPTTPSTAAPATTVATPTPTATSTTTPAPTSTTRAGTAMTTTARPTAARAVIEPATVAGIPLGANKSQAIAVLGQPTTMGQEADLSGRKYDFLRWQISGNRGLTLNFRTESVTSPLLTDWNANAAGPVTTKSIQVGDGAAKVTAAHGPLVTFCCESKVASVTQGPGRMIVVVADDTQKVIQITGGDPAFWSRSIAD